MIAFDTNLLVRLAVNDNERQAAIAEQLLEDNEVFVSRTVLLETEWVLRSAYKHPRSDIANFFEAMLSADNLVIENPVKVGLALDWYKSGADFADAMHLCITGERVMHTFDQRFCKQVRELDVVPNFVVLGQGVWMKLRAKHSDKYLSVTKNKDYATQQVHGDDFIFDKEQEAANFGRIVLAKTFHKTKMCLQLSSMTPRDGWLIGLAPYQEDNPSQLWCFTDPDEAGSFIIKNMKERDDKGIRLKESCLNVCEAKGSPGTAIISYHATQGKSAENERWFLDKSE